MSEDDVVSLRHFALGPLKAVFKDLEDLGVEAPQFLQELWDEDAPATGDPPAFWDIVGISDDHTTRIAGGRRLEASVVPMPGHEPALELPGTGGCALLFAQFGTVGIDVKEPPGLVLSGPALALRLPEGLFRGTPDAANPSAPTKAEITISGIGELSADTQGNVDLKPLTQEGLVVAARNTPWTIGDTGFELDPGTLKIEFQDRLEQFRVSLTGASLKLPPEFAAAGDEAKLSLETAAIDKNGFSGRVSAELHPTWDEASGAFSGAGSVNLGGLDLGIQRAMIQFDKNVPTGFELRAEAALPFFDTGRPVMTVGYNADKALTLGAEAAGGGSLELKKEGVATFVVKKVGLRIDAAGKAELTFSGDLKPEMPDGLEIPDFTIQVEDLKVGTDGRVRLKSGWVVFQPELTAGLNGFGLTLYKAGIGLENSRFWVSLDGKVALVDGLPSAEVKGFKIAYDPGASIPVDFGLEGIYLDASIAEVALIRGDGRLIKEPDKSGFAGDMLLGLPQLGFALDVSMLAGINTATPPFPFFYLAVGVDLPAAIPLGQSGLGLFGAQGLLGINVYPSFEGGAGKSWYYDWYKAPPVSGVTHSSKWRDKYLAFALGAGVTLCTADGFTVLTRSLLVLALPGPLLLVEGRAAFLTTRSALGDNPPLRALMVLDLRESSRSIQLFIEAQYEFVEGVLFAHGVLEVYSELKANPNWFIYLGRKEPEAMRIQAEILKKLLRGNAYFQLDGSGTRFGALVGYQIKKAAGPARVNLDLGASLDAGISFDPEQLQALLHLWGKLLVKVFGIGVDFSIDASAEARVPTPWWLGLYFQLKLNLPWPLPDLDLEFEQTFEEEIPPPFPAVLTQVQALAARSQDTWDLATPQVDNIPLDAKICLAMAHRAANRTATLIGGLESERSYLHAVGDYTFEFALEKLDLVREDDPAPQPVYGMWQAEPQLQPEATGGTLMLNSRTAFAYSRWLLDDEVPSSVADQTNVRPARSDYRLTPHCLTFGQKLEAVRHRPLQFEMEGVRFRVRKPALVLECPEGYEGSGPLRAGLNVLSAYGADFSLKGTPDQPRARLSPVVLEIRWPETVQVVRLEAQADRVLAGLRNKLFPFDGEGALDRLYLIGTLISVQQVCTVTLADAQGHRIARANRTAGDRLLEDMGTGWFWRDEEFVFAPRSRYTLYLEVLKSRAGEIGGTESEVRTVKFTTGGTPDDLSPYLRTTGPPSAGQPSAAGGSGHEGACIPPGFQTEYPDGTWAPVYGQDPVCFFFNAGYLRKMYEMVAGERLEIVFLDPGGQKVEGRVTQWAKAATRADGENVGLSLEAVNRSLLHTIPAEDLPRDDVLVSRPGTPVSGQPPPGLLLPGVTHTVEIRCHRGTDTEPALLYQTRVRASQFANWQALFASLDARVPCVDIGFFGGADLTGLTSLDEPAALPLVGSPLPSRAMAVVVHDAQRNHDILLLELPEPLPSDGFELTWLDGAGAPLNLPALLRSDRTRSAWHGPLPTGISGLRIRRSRPGALAGEPALVVESVVVPVQMQGGTP